MSDEAEPILDPQTEASVQGVVRSKAELAAWKKNLERALTDDLTAEPPRLTAEQAAKIAKDHEVAFEAPKPAPKPEAHKPLEDHQQHEAAAGHHEPPPPVPHHEPPVIEKEDNGKPGDKPKRRQD